MNVLLVVGAGALLLLVASRTYPFWIARVFDLRDDRPPPAEEFADGSDYVAAPTQVVFAHHFASIAGAGPIVGPILALAFGWGPAWLWIVLGGILYGAVHDMTSMCVSLREGGRTIAEIARRTLGRGGYLLFVVFLVLVLCLINAIFLNLSATALTSVLPFETLGVPAEDSVLERVVVDGRPGAQIGGIATTSVFIMTALAPLLGLAIHRGRVRGTTATLLAAAVCGGSVVAGFYLPIRFYAGADVTGEALGAAADLWRWLLAGYVFVGCWIPVWLILTPRDFCNVQILYGGIALLFLGIVVGGLRGGTLGTAEALTLDEGARTIGSVWPFVFITIACGAISGFHSLVASGTTVKQIPRETDCRRVGYNAMLLESFLALLVLAAVAGQLGRGEYMAMVHGEGRNAVLAFALACGRTFAQLGIPLDIGSVLGILIVEGFVITTLDTAVRLCRYLLEELWDVLLPARPGAALGPLAWLRALLRRRLFNTTLACAGMLAFAFSNVYDRIWTIFGSGNQLIGALALTTVSIWLLKRRRPWLFTAIPAAFMVITTIAALWTRLRIDHAAGNHALAGAGAFLLFLAIGFVLIAAVRVYAAARDYPAAIT